MNIVQHGIGNLEGKGLPVHVLKTTVGVEVRATIDPETLQLCTSWSPAPPYSSKQIKRIVKEFTPFRNKIILEAARLKGAKVMIITPEEL